MEENNLEHKTVYVWSNRNDRGERERESWEMWEVLKRSSFVYTGRIDTVSDSSLALD